MALTEVLTSSIKYKAARAAGRDADHHGFVGRALLLGQQLVAVIDIARDDLGLAGATHALAAAVVGAEARLNECVEQGHTGRHLDRSAASAQFHGVAAGGNRGCGRRGGGKAFQVYVLLAQALAGAFIGIEHGAGAAAIEVGARRMVGEQAFEVRWATLLVVEMTSQRKSGVVSLNQRFDLGQEGRLRAASRAIDELRLAPERCEAPQHGVDRCDANAPGQQHAAWRGLVQPEVVARRTDGDGLAHAKLLVYEA